MANFNSIMSGMKNLFAQSDRPVTIAQANATGDDEQAIRLFHERYRMENRHVHWSFCQKWFLHDLFDIGAQRIRNFPNLLDRVAFGVQLPEEEDTIVHNLYKQTLEGFISIMMKYPLGIEFHPTSSDPKSVMASRVSEKIWPVLKDQVDWDGDLRQLIHRYEWKYGSAFVYSGVTADSSKGFWANPKEHIEDKEVSPSMAQCSTCGFQAPTPQPPGTATCPSCGQPTLQFQPALSIPMTVQDPPEQIPFLKLFAEVVQPYEVKLSLYARRMEDSHYLIRTRNVPVERAQEIAQGLGYNEPINEDRSYDIPNLIQDILRAATGLSPMLGYGAYGIVNPHVTQVTEMWLDPVCYQSNKGLAAKYHKGLYACIMNQKVIHAEDEHFLECWSQFRRSAINGTPYAYGEDGLIQRQILLNETESALAEDVEFSSSPLFYNSQMITANKIDWRRKAAYKVNLVGTDRIENAAHRLDSAVPIQPKIEYMEMLMQSFKDLPGITDAALGVQPDQTVATIGQSRMLLEGGLMRQQPMMMLNKKAFQGLARQLVGHVRKHPEFKVVVAVEGKDGTFYEQNFMGSQIETELDIVVKTGIDQPMTYGERLQAMDALLQHQALNMQDPMVQEYLMDLHGVTISKALGDGDRRQVYRDLDAIRQALSDPKSAAQFVKPGEDGQPQLVGIPVQPRKYIDNHLLQMEIIKDYVQDDDFMKQPPLVQQAIMMLSQQHMQQQQELSSEQAPPPRMNINTQVRGVMPMDQASAVAQGVTKAGSQDLQKLQQQGGSQLEMELGAQQADGRAKMITAQAKQAQADSQAGLAAADFHRKATETATNVAGTMTDYDDPSEAALEMAQMALDAKHKQEQLQLGYDKLAANERAQRQRAAVQSRKETRRPKSNG